MYLGSVEAIKELVRAGLGCAILPKMSCGRRDTGLQFCSLTPGLERKLAFVVRRDRPITRGIKALHAGLVAAATSSIR
ncbi:MAG: LysR family transcriptional regulator substrate-binding protein [Alphaproteobacteria bacterium]|nr:LysR family transcriptional regulator substrate-binding protein [Alphaproteobacteria bacterium]MBU1763561.1 LysR family transcriptional regulator substrate-binding protein [Alphaproteobacteria bacterium]